MILWRYSVNAKEVYKVTVKTKGNKYYEGIFEKNKFVVANTRSFYTGTNLKKVAFVAKRNDKLTLKKIKNVKGKVYLQFQKGKKTGWQQVEGKNVYKLKSRNLGSTGWFYGVYGRLVP